MNVFNKIKLTRYQKAVIWDVFKGDKEPQNLTSDDLNKVIYLLPAIPEDDLSNLNTSDWKIVEILGRIRGFSRSQISVIANSLRFKWDKKTLTKADYINKYSGLICGFPEDELAIIPKIEFRKINSSVFANLFTCSENQFRILHDQVIKVYGIPQSWSEKLITHIGMIILSLTKNEIRSLRPSVLQGLDIGLIATFKPEILDFFTSEQLRSLNPPKIVTKSGSGRTSVPEIWLFPLYLLLKC
ncbi:Stereocilin-like Protein [Tribolium castaneum]|uniref:Stereocilin-like Protein n=1 Tax=Tribolium castaneum TaxID=7070 RepID=D6WNU1_TRICA|nr:Stereocilin-like Protein [Tribolium castaneum]